MIIHFAQNHYKTINPCSITLKFGTDKQQANFHTKFCMNLINTQEDITNIRGKNIKSSVTPSYRVSHHGNGLKFGIDTN